MTPGPRWTWSPACVGGLVRKFQIGCARNKTEDVHEASKRICYARSISVHFQAGSETSETYKVGIGHNSYSSPNENPEHHIQMSLLDNQKANGTNSPFKNTCSSTHEHQSRLFDITASLYICRLQRRRVMSLYFPRGR